MLYYVIRFIIVAVLIFLIFINRLYVNKYKLNLIKQSKNFKKHILPKFVSILLILVLVFLPYEQYFLRFSTSEASVKYSVPNAFFGEIVTVKEKDIDFMIVKNNNNYSYHSAIKYDDDSFSFCNYKSKVNFSFTPQLFNSQDNIGVCTLGIVYNSYVDKTCYFLGLVRTDGNGTVDVYKNSREKLLFLRDFQGTYYYYYVKNGAPHDNNSFIVDGEKIVF